jgi:hypothetical protein
MQIERLTLEESRQDVWLETAPAYQVDFWRRLSPASGVDPSRAGWARESFRVSAPATITEVLAWVEANADARSAVVWAVIQSGVGPGRVQLLGTDPTAPRMDAADPF